MSKEINNNIFEHYCSKEVSKLLKEKGFKVPVLTYYDKCEIVSSNITSVFNAIDYNNDYLCYSRPTHSVAIEWIRVNFGIWIQGAFPLSKRKWEWIIFDLKEKIKGQNCYKNIMSLNYEPHYFDTPYEATEAALLYTLKNLI